MENTIPNGTQVLIFSKIKENKNNFIIGTIINSEVSESLSNEGYYNKTIYYVIDENGKNYICTYGETTFGNFYILTYENYINYLNELIRNNQMKISTLEEENIKYNNILNSLENNKPKTKKRLNK